MISLLLKRLAREHIYVDLSYICSLARRFNSRLITRYVLQQDVLIVESVLLGNISMISLLLKRLAREHIYDKSIIKASC
jgi:hypothetical protein